MLEFFLAPLCKSYLSCNRVGSACCSPFSLCPGCCSGSTLPESSGESFARGWLLDQQKGTLLGHGTPQGYGRMNVPIGCHAVITSVQPYINTVRCTPGYTEHKRMPSLLGRARGFSLQMRRGAVRLFSGCALECGRMCRGRACYRGRQPRGSPPCGQGGACNAVGARQAPCTQRALGMSNGGPPAWRLAHPLGGLGVAYSSACQRRGGSQHAVGAGQCHAGSEQVGSTCVGRLPGPAQAAAERADGAMRW